MTRRALVAAAVYFVGPVSPTLLMPLHGSSTSGIRAPWQGGLAPGPHRKDARRVCRVYLVRPGGVSIR